MKSSQADRVPWKRYVLATSETIFTFTLASFLLGLFIMHRGDSSIATIVAAVLIYLSVVVFSVYRMVRKYSLAANMLMIPIAPFIIMMIVVSLIHVLQYFQ
jgi:hypothetical protein